MIKHGMAYSRIYNTYRDMKARCSNPNKRIYKHYGGRGIKVCDEWLGVNGFIHFYQWAMANGYEENLEIDRINVDGDYSPDNCRWADRSMQNINKRITGNCEYIGVSARTSGDGYYTSIKFHNKRLFVFCSRSKNECAKARNDFIIANHLPHPLNEIKEEFEDVKPLKVGRKKRDSHR